MIKVGALLQDEGPWFFTLFSREEPPFLRVHASLSFFFFLLSDFEMLKNIVFKFLLLDFV